MRSIQNDTKQNGNKCCLRYSPRVLFLNLMYCRVQYNTANNSKNYNFAPASHLWSGTGQRTSSSSQAILALDRQRGGNPLACLIKPWHASTEISETACLLALAIPLSLPCCRPSPPTLPRPSFLSLLPTPSPLRLWCPWPLPSRLSGSIVSNLNSFSQSLWCISRIILTVIFAKKYVHFSKQFVQTAPHNAFPEKACNLLKIVHLSNVSIYVNEHISAIRMKSPCVIVHKQDSQNLVMLSI